MTFQNKVFPKLKIVLLNENDSFPQLTDFSSFLIVSIKSKKKTLLCSYSTSDRN